MDAANVVVETSRLDTPAQNMLKQSNPEPTAVKLRRFGQLLVPVSVSDKVVSE